MVDLLVLKYDIKGEMALGDIAASLTALNYQFNREVKKDTILKRIRPELEIVKMTMASPLNVELKTLAKQTVIIATVEFVIAQTLGGMQAGFTNLLGQGPKPAEGYEKGQLEAYRDFLKPLSNQAGNIHIEGHKGSKIVVNMTINTNDARSIREKALEEEKLLDLPVVKPFTMALLRVKVAVDETGKEQAGDRGIIPDISSDLVKLSYPSAEIKRSILEHPFSQTFMVSGEAEIVDGKPKRYKITELHEIEVKK